MKKSRIVQGIVAGVIVKLEDKEEARLPGRGFSIQYNPLISLNKQGPVKMVILRRLDI